MRPPRLLKTSEVLHCRLFSIHAYDAPGNVSDVPFTVVRDASAPTAGLSVPTRSSSVTVTVEWNADDGAGAGIAGYDVQVSTDDGPWTGWLTATTQTQDDFVGQFGRRYTFRARARDNVGNLGDWSAAVTTSVVQVTKYYHFGAQRIAMRQGDVVYYLHGDHLGSTSLATTAAGALHARQGYYPYGETRTGDLTALPTDFGFTGQRLDPGFGLYHMGARWYDPVIGRWISADTLVPNPASPQDFNRYAYVRNNPLKYVDPTGHDLMLVGGYNNDNWEDPGEWEQWIRRYKGWTEDEWNDFYTEWGKADDAAKKQLMADNSIYFFDWTVCKCMDDTLAFGDDPHQNASRHAYVDKMLGELEKQLKKLQDVTLIGHSKGGNLVLNYMQRNGKHVKNAVTIDAVWKAPVIRKYTRSMEPIMDETGHPFFKDTAANIVNIYNVRDDVNSRANGYYNGDVMNLRVDESEHAHSTKGGYALYTLYVKFNVASDHGASGGLRGGGLSWRRRR